MSERDTKELESELLRAKTPDDFIRENEKEFRTKSVSEYLNEMMIKYNAEKKDIVCRSGLSGTYAYQIFDGRKSASREKLIQMAFGFPLTLEETNRLLSCGGYSSLYVRNKREAYLIYALECRYDIRQVNDLLYKNREKAFE